MENITISFKNVSKSFYLQDDRTFKELLPNLLTGKPWAKKFNALSSITFDVAQGETVGIVGKNGSGKSTLLKLIAGVTFPSTGSVHIKGKVAPLIELGAGFHYELSGYENIFLNAAILGMHKKEIEAKVDEIIKFSELEDFIHIPVKKYSSGMYMRLGFSIAINTNALILLIDEVLAVGDIAFQEKCMKKLKEIKASGEKTIIFVSHDERSVKNFCDRAILINDSKIVIDGKTDKVFEKYHEISHLGAS